MKAPSSSSIPVAILCGGLATRLGDLTKDTPKSLIEVAGKPFLSHQMKLLRTQGFHRIVLCTGHLGHKIWQKFGASVIYSDEGDLRLGTGGAVKRALPFLGKEFFVLYGDSYLPIDYTPIREELHSSGKLACMSTWEGKDYGMNIFRAEAFEGFNGSFLHLHDVFDSLASRNELATYETGERFYEIGSPEGLEEVRKLLA